MTHVRTQIREAAFVLAQAIPGITAGKSRFRRYESLPALNVFTGDEDVDTRGDDSIGQDTTYDRFIDLMFEILISEESEDEEDLQLICDAYAVEIEKRVAANETWGGIAIETRYAGSFEDAEALEADPAQSLIVRFRVWYATTGLDPESHINRG